jgi:hypothetical protein
MMKSAVYLADNLLDPKTAASQESLDTPMSRAFGRQHFFEFLEKPENEYRFRRFGAAMLGSIASSNSDAVMTGKFFPCISDCHEVNRVYRRL